MIESLSRTGTWKTYSTNDGLPSLRMVYIAEDGEGYIWFATYDNGACRFDGDAFQHFTTQDGLIHDHVSCIQTDRQGRLWFGTLNGVCWYDGVGFHYLADDGMVGCDVKSIYEDRQGRIWFGGTSTVGYYDGTTFHDLTPLYLEQYQPPLPPDFPPNSCVGIAQDPQGHLWFGFKDLIRFDGESFHRYEAAEGFPRIKAGYSVGEDHTGKVWIGRIGRGLLYYYDNNTFHSVKEGLNCWLRRITCDRDGRLWFSTVEGVFYQDEDGFSRFTAADGLPHSSVYAVFHDREDQFWFATPNGIGCYDAHSITVFDLRANIRKTAEVSQIAQDRQGDIWIGYVSPRLNHPGKSVARFDGAHFTFVESEQGRDISNCFSICEDLEGHLWFGSGEGLFRRADQTLKKENLAAAIDAGGISCITQDRRGGFIFGYWEHYNIRQGNRKFLASPLQIVYQQGESFQTIFAEDEEKILYSRIGAVIATRNDEIYFHLIYRDYLVSGTGFARWHPEEGLTWYGVDDGLIDNRVNDLVLDRDGNLWIATQDGLSCFDGRTFRSFTTDDGLPSNRIHCLLADARGRLWIGTDREVAQYDGQVFQTVTAPHISSVCRIFEDRDGTFWLGTVLGSVIRYRPRQTPPRIRLTRVTTDQVYETVADGHRSTAGQPVVFEYKGMGLTTPPRDMLYVYRLQGYDPDWCPATRELQASYQDLPPGDYTFQVRAIGRDLNYSETAQVPLVVDPDPQVAFTGGSQWIGLAKGLREFQTQLTEVAPTSLAVLIIGETGVGKGLAAQTLHALSAYGDGPFIQVNCRTVSQASIDGELFGRDNKQATSEVGKVELAKGGTLFLDEIGDLTLDTQDKILRLLEERTFERVGSKRTRKAQTRIVAATSRDLQKMVKAGFCRP